MPSYHQIETYIQLELLTDFPFQIEKFSNLLQKIGVMNQENRDWLETISWQESENGFVYAVDSGNVQIKSLESLLTVRPAFLGLTAGDIAELKKVWISFQLLFLSHEVDDYTDSSVIRYKKDASQTVIRIMQVCAQTFLNENIFFTHEAQDGVPWDGQMENDQKKMWQFELGSVPLSFLPMTKKPNENFHVWEQNARIWFANKQVFPDSPFGDIYNKIE